MTAREPLRRLLESNLTIPTLPAVVQRLNALVEDDSAGTREIGAVVAEDAPIAAKVMRIANSAFYGLATPCLSTEHATTVLGVRVLRNIVLQASVLQQYEHLTGVHGIDVPGLWAHSVRTARVCAELGRRARGTLGLSPDELHACGLLHDIGRVVLLDAQAGDYAALVHEALDTGVPLQEVERARLGFDHTDVGAFVAERWGLPSAAHEAIAGHHAPAGHERTTPVAALVAQADALAGDGDAAALDAGFARRFGIDAEGEAAVLAVTGSEPELAMGDAA